jgi:hypothetical protein
MVMLEETPAPARPSSWKPVVLAAVATLLVAATCWWLLAGSKPPAPSSSAWLGTVSSAPAASNGNTVCVQPLPGEPSGIVDGKPWCGTAYPSRGLEIEDLTIGSSVRVVTFITTERDGTDVSGVLVLPGDLPNPPSA